MKNLFFFVLLLCHLGAFGQWLDLDYNSAIKRESQFNISLFKYFQAGMTTLGHLDASSEILKINFKTSSSVSIGLAVAGTQTFIIGNKSDKRNNFSHLLNPTGGIVNGSLFMNFRLKKKEKYTLKLNARGGLKLIEGSPLQGLKSRFKSTFGQFGLTYERLLFEDAPENQRIDFWSYPHLLYCQVGEADLSSFFGNELKPQNYGYGWQTGVEFNRQLRITCLLNQFLNTPKFSTLGIAVLRLNVSYQF